jgi:DNA repair exonuclease SbcCD ATPase subunit
MRLIECYAENFGMLHEHTHKFTPGLNTVYAKNGSGKTTLTAFIKAMLYGFADTRKSTVEDNERLMYKPWQGGRYGGSLTFESEGRIYRIERTFGQKASEDETAVIDAARGVPTQEFGDDVGRALFGIDRDGFVRTVFLSEKKLPWKIENETISSKLSELVGADGDVGGYKSAMDALEKRRKFYDKRGSGGEIYAVKAKIAECDATLAVLERRREEAKGYELSLARLESELAKLGEERIRLEEKLAEERAGLAKRAKTEQYRSMLENLEEEKKNLEALREYFKNGVPTGTEIDEVRDAALEARRLRAEVYAKSPELIELSTFFTRETDFAEIDGMFRTKARRKAAEDELTALEARIVTARESELTEFGDSTPDPTVLERHSRILAKGGSTLMIVILLTCIVPIVFLGALVSPWLYALAIPLAVAAIIVGSKRVSEVNAANACASELGIRGDDISGKLAALAKRLRDGDASVKDNAAKIEILKRGIREDGDTVAAFIGAYPHGASDTSAALEIISDKFKLYYTLKIRDNENKLSRESAEIRIAALDERVRAFLSKYETYGENPFEEIRVKLNTYNFAKMTVERDEADCRTYAQLHGISPEEIVLDTSSKDENASVLLCDNSDRISDLRREHTLLSRTYADCQLECDRADEISAVREGYADKLVTYTENLEVIRMAQRMLTEACENMTSKYIGGTKERFLKYEALIGEDEGEYAIDTDFDITKNDRGGTRQMDSYSRGTRDLHSFALRLALIDSLYDGACPLVILDDPFTSFDDKRLEGAKAMVKAIAKEKQVLYFTCTKERAI